ncbi:MAG: lmo0937 family membrane protein [Sphingobacteriales bacterium]
MRSLIYIIVVVLVISWLLGGFAFHIGGNAIHIIVVIAVILLLFNLLGGRGGSYRRRWW